jgi:agmatine deiminase
MVADAMKQLRASTDALGRPLECLSLHSPGYVRSNTADFLNAYCNYYICNGAVIMPQFGDLRADANAAAVLRECYPGRDIVQLNVDHIYENGGGIHCVTQQQPQGHVGRP